MTRRRSREDSGCLEFPTGLGTCRIRWSGKVITSIQLVEPRDRTGLAGTGRIPAFVRDAARRLTGHLAGAVEDLSDIPLDLEDVPPFHRVVYRTALSIPSGARLSYGALAARAGAPGAARAVGTAMRRNPFLIVVPCHRIVAADGGLGGFSAPGGLRTKRRLLAIERDALRKRDRERESQWPFDLDKARRHVTRRDAVLGDAIRHLGAVRYQRQSGTPYQALFRAIVYQQLSGKAASTILGRVLAGYAPKAFPHPAEVIDTPNDELRAAGLSRAKTAAVKDLSARVLDGTVPSLRRLSAMSDEDVIDHLVQVRGVGRWTAEMFLISQLGRPDIMPVDDLGVRKGFTVLYGKRSPGARPGTILPASQLREHAEAWRPYRTIAAWYLWQAADSLEL
jgi:methylated-DNA-[protein]-cysteine S-methyltransferase